MTYPNAVAENVFGTMGAIFWSVQLIPQIWKTYRTKSVEGLSPWLVLLWGWSGAFLGPYAIILNLNIPLIVQPQLFGALGILSWTQCMYYGRRMSRLKCAALLLGSYALFGGWEVGMVYAIRPSYERGDIRGTRALGIISSIIIAVGLLPQYYEIYRLREVVGVSIAFMVVDLLGGVFSDLSLAFKDTFDVLAGVFYTIPIVMDALVIIAALVLNPRARKRRARDAERGGVDENTGGDAQMIPLSAEETVVSEYATRNEQENEKDESDQSKREISTC